MSGPLSSMEALQQALEAQGLYLRGWVVFGPGETGAGIPGRGIAQAVLLLGPIGGSLWGPFSAWRAAEPDHGGAHPLDRWSKLVIGALADAIEITAIFPFEQPYQPFQQWAIRAEGLKASLLGLLIHPRYGLWHSYRGALVFTGEDVLRFGLDLSALAEQEEPGRLPSPCDVCATRPCLSACPTHAVHSDRFDVAACRAHLAALGQGEGCMGAGCLARNACPVGADFRPGEAQLRFHMEALLLQQI